MSVDPTAKNSGVASALALIAGLTVVAASGVGAGAWCGKVTLTCLWYAPMGTPGALLFFGVPVALVEAAVVMTLKYVVNVRLGWAIIAALIVSQAVLGFVVGATALAGQGP